MEFKTGDPFKNGNLSFFQLQSLVNIKGIGIKKPFLKKLLEKFGEIKTIFHHENEKVEFTQIYALYTKSSSAKLLLEKAPSILKKFSVTVEKATYQPGTQSVTLPNPEFNSMEKIFSNRKIEYENPSDIKNFMTSKPHQNELEDVDPEKNKIKMKKRLLTKRIKKLKSQGNEEDTPEQLIQVRDAFNDFTTKERFHDINERELRKKRKEMKRKYNCQRSKMISKNN